jgi:hypothetical protein
LRHCWCRPATKEAADLSQRSVRQRKVVLFLISKSMDLQGITDRRQAVSELPKHGAVQAATDAALQLNFSLKLRLDNALATGQAIY